VESDCECAEMEINGKGIVDPKIINESLPGGMALLSAERLNAGSGSVSADIAGFRYAFYLGAPELGEAAARKVDDFLKSPEFVIKRKTKEKETTRDIRPLVSDIVVEGQVLKASLLFGAGGGVKPSEVLDKILQLDPGQAAAVRVRKTGILKKTGSGAAHD